MAEHGALGSGGDRPRRPSGAGGRGPGRTVSAEITNTTATALEPAPASGAVSPRRRLLESDAFVRAFADLEREIGGRAKLVAALSMAPLTDEEAYIVGLLADPENTSAPLARILAQGRVGPGRLLALFKDAIIAAAQVHSARTVSEQLPAVVADVMKYARERTVTCIACLGAGTVTPDATQQNPNPAPRQCRHCGGNGTVVEEPDHDIAKTALMLGGLLQQPGGPRIAILNQNQQAAVAGGAPTSFEDVVRLVDRQLYGDPRRHATREQTEFEASADEAGDAPLDGEVLPDAAPNPPAGSTDTAPPLAGG